MMSHDAVIHSGKFVLVNDWKSLSVSTASCEIQSARP